MRCLFCKNPSSTSSSLEHIVPESLGNKSFVLSKGIVCDSCNNYFATKIEKRVVESDFFRNIRFRNAILSKKNRIVEASVVIPETNFKTKIWDDKENKRNLLINLDEYNFELASKEEIKNLIIPYHELPLNNPHLSRLLAKMGLEMMAHSLSAYNEGLKYLVEETQLDAVREYARYNNKQEIWEYSVRKIYEEDKLFIGDDKSILDKIFEADFLNTESEMYFVFAYKGIEFVINMAGSSLYGFQRWLDKNGGISPLSLKDDKYSPL